MPVVPPAFVPPCLPKLTTKPPAGDGWIHEPKFDGWRIQIVRSGPRLAFYSRHGRELTERLAALAEACSALPGRSCVIDGELVPSAAGGFWTLPQAISRGGAGASTVAFDLLHLDGCDLRSLPLIERKGLLQGVLAKADIPHLVYAEEFDDGLRLLTEAGRLGLEGVSKRRDAPYQSGRTSSWLKIKCPAWVAANRERWRIFERNRHTAS